jgi:hypothetical protein
MLNQSVALTQSVEGFDLLNKEQNE